MSTTKQGDQMTLAQWLDCTSTVEMFNVLGDQADERRRGLFEQHLIKLYAGPKADWNEYQGDSPELESDWCAIPSRYVDVSEHDACNLIRCLWPPPMIAIKRIGHARVRPKWYFGRVADLALKVKYLARIAESNGNSNPGSNDEALQIMTGPMVEALIRAGCDDEAVLQHLRQPVHAISKCWVIKELLFRNSNKSRVR